MGSCCAPESHVEEDEDSDGSSRSSASSRGATMTNNASSSDVLGDLCCGSTGKVLCSQKVENRTKQSVRFLVDPQQGDDNNKKIVLCWVNARGALKHHYTYPMEEGMDHDEGTYVGDAFCVFTQDTNAAKPQTTDDLNSPVYKVLCSYRLKKALDRSRFTHEVHVAEDGSCTVTAASEQHHDREYRVEAGLPDKPGVHHLPPCDQSWEIMYKFTCPPLPSIQWNKRNQTFYVWGDVDFDDYGPRSWNKHPVHPCPMNQIVPQVMMGHCLASADENYKPSWDYFDSWVIQSQYYWQRENKKCGSMCGELIPVNPGDLLCTRISYDSDTGILLASIAVVDEDGKDDPKRTSEIVCTRPFPHNPSLFRDWKDFFQQCQDSENKGSRKIKSRRLMEGKSNDDSSTIMGPLARPCLNIEYKGRVSVDTLKSICPLEVKEATFPGVGPEMTSMWQTDLYCPGVGTVAKLVGQTQSSLTLQEAITLDGVPGGTPKKRLKATS